MVHQPRSAARNYVDAGCELVIVHAETCPHLHRTLAAIRELGRQEPAWRSTRPRPEPVRHVLDLIDLILVMTVEPRLRRAGLHRHHGAQDRRGPGPHRRPPGGRSSSRSTGASGPRPSPGRRRAGADVLVAGSALFRDPEGLEHAVADLRARAEAARGLDARPRGPNRPTGARFLPRRAGGGPPAVETKAAGSRISPDAEVHHLTSWRIDPIDEPALREPRRPRIVRVIAVAVASLLMANGVILAEQLLQPGFRQSPGTTGCATPAAPWPGPRPRRGRAGSRGRGADDHHHRARPRPRRRPPPRPRPPPTPRLRPLRRSRPRPSPLRPKPMFPP